MSTLHRGITWISGSFNALAGLAVVIMMLLTCADVVMRLFRSPVPGTYEIVGFLGTVVIAFSLAQTSLEKGHIAVEIVVAKLPQRVQIGVDAFVCLIGSALFALIARQSFIYALDIKGSGEVSVTLMLPIYPFILGIAAGSGLLCIVLALDSVRSAVRAVLS